MPTNYNDGAWTTGIQTGADLVTYPFLDYPIPDVYARKYQSSIAILPANYQPSIANRTTYTNLLTYSEALTNAAWTALNNTVTDNVTTNPMDGQTTMSRFIETAANAEHRIAHALTFTAVPTTLYCFIRGGLGRTNFYLRANDGTTDFSGYFDISTAAGAVGTLANATGVIYAMGDGSYLIAITFTPLAASGNVYLNVASSGSVISYAGDTAKGMYVWGVDAKAQSAVTPYVSTTSNTRSISAPDWFTPTVSFTGIPDPFAFEVDETDLVISDLARAKFLIAYARIPKPQDRPSSIVVSKPALSGTFPQVFGAYRIFQPDTTQDIYDAYVAKTVTSDTGIPNYYPTGGTYYLAFAGSNTNAISYNTNATGVQTLLNAITPIANRGNVAVTGAYNTAGGLAVAFNNYAAATINTGSLTFASGSANAYQVTSLNGGYNQTWNITSTTFDTITGGTYTVTMFGDTTAAINYNASLAQISTAINALTGVTNRGGCVITGIYSPNGIGGSNTSIYFTISFANAVIGENDVSLTPVGSSVMTAITDGVGKAQTIKFMSATALRSLYATNHGATETAPIFVKGDASYYSVAVGDFSIPDANTISLTITPSLGYSNVTNITEVGPRTKANYAPGSASVSCDIITSFYLPGVTAGVNTANDISIPVQQSDATPFLNAVFSGTGNVNYVVGQLDQWIGPILMLSLTATRAANI